MASLEKRLAKLEFSHKETAYTVNKDMITYNMMHIAVDSVSKEFELQMKNHISSLQLQIKSDIEDFATKDVSYDYYKHSSLDILIPVSNGL
jgi:hypothetical protein